VILEWWQYLLLALTPALRLAWQAFGK